MISIFDANLGNLLDSLGEASFGGDNILGGERSPLGILECIGKL